MLVDVDKSESIDPRDLPIRLTFWRKVQTHVKHKNPLFDEALGVTPDILVVDSLHALNLGTLKRFAQGAGLADVLESSLDPAAGESATGMD